MMFEDMSPLQLCPLHCSTEGGSLQRMNTPRNRRPLLQCCSAATLHMSPSGAAVQCCAEAEARLQARRLVLRNIAIPASFYTATDPRHADTRAALRSLGTRQAPGPGSRLVSRSASSVSVRRAQHVRLATSSPAPQPRPLARSQSFTQPPGGLQLHPGKLSATLSSSVLPWEYKLAGIGKCWKGRRRFCLFIILCIATLSFGCMKNMKMFHGPHSP